MAHSFGREVRVTEARTVECSTHGARTEAFVCQHLVESLQTLRLVGFFWAGVSKKQRPDAWCSDCNERVARTDGDWIGEAAAHLGAHLICSGCYDELRWLNGVGLPH
jgi:hypothetical protein